MNCVFPIVRFKCVKDSRCQCMYAYARATCSEKTNKNIVRIKKDTIFPILPNNIAQANLCYMIQTCTV